MTSYHSKQFYLPYMIQKTKLVDENSPLSDWLELADFIAKENFSGHFTIYAFTFSYKFAFGTVTERDQINELIG